MSNLQQLIDKLDNPGTPNSAPGRALNTPFQPSTTRYTLCIYTIQHVATVGQDGNVELRSDAANPPTTVRAASRLAAAANHTERQVLVYVCPPGDFVSLVSGGTGTPTIAFQTEIPIS